MIARSVAVALLLSALVATPATGSSWRAEEVFRGALDGDQVTADDVGHLVFLPFKEEGSVVRAFDARDAGPRDLAPRGACGPVMARRQVVLLRCGGGGVFVSQLDADRAGRLPELGAGAVVADLGRRWVLFRRCVDDDRTELRCGPRQYIDWRTGARAGPYADDRERSLDTTRPRRARRTAPAPTPTRRTDRRLVTRTRSGRQVVLSRRCGPTDPCRVAIGERHVLWLIGRTLRAYDRDTGRRRETRLPVSGDGRTPVVVGLWSTRRAAFVHIGTGEPTVTSAGTLSGDLLLSLSLTS